MALGSPARRAALPGGVSLRRYAPDAIDRPLGHAPFSVVASVATLIIFGRVFFWYLAVPQMIAILSPVLIALLAQRYIARGLPMEAIRG